MKEGDWIQLRTYIEHSGLTFEQVVDACKEAQAKEQAKQAALPLPDPRQMDLPVGPHLFNGA